MADTFAPTYLSATSVKASSGAELLASKKLEKYQDLEQRYIFCPVAVETMGVGRNWRNYDNRRFSTKLRGPPLWFDYPRVGID